MPPQKEIKEKINKILKRRNENYLLKKEAEEYIKTAYLREANNYPCWKSTGGCWEKSDKWYPTGWGYLKISPKTKK